MATDLPSNVGYGTVVGRFLLSVADGPDPGRNPDGKAAAGTVTFTASAERLLNVTAVPPVTIIPQPIVCTLDASGNLIDPEGGQGVVLIATDDPDLNPTGWTYLVQVELDDVPRWQFSMHLPQTKVVDLSTVVPVASADGAAIVRGLPGDSAYEIAVDEGFTGSESAWLASLVGPPGVGVADITVDTSVGTRVFIGGVMVHGQINERSLRPSTGVSGVLIVTRTNDIVTLTFDGLVVADDGGGWTLLTGAIPNGFRPARATYTQPSPRNVTEYDGSIRININGDIHLYTYVSKPTEIRSTIVYSTKNPWPVTLPGTPA